MAMDKVVMVRLDDEHIKKLDRLAEKLGMNRSQYLRFLLERAR